MFRFFSIKDVLRMKKKHPYKYEMFYRTSYLPLHQHILRSTFQRQYIIRNILKCCIIFKKLTFKMHIFQIFAFHFCTYVYISEICMKQKLLLC